MGSTLQQAHFHFGGRLFLIREFSMTNLMVGCESRVDGCLFGKRMRGQQQPELLLLGQSGRQVICRFDRRKL